MTAAADPAPGQGIVLFDGDCRLCRGSVRVLERLDWLDRLHFQNARETDRLPPATVPLDPGKLLAEMHVLPPGRDRAYAGFAAFRWVAWRLPLTVAVAPLLYLPGVAWAGNRVYLWVAKNRFGLVPCRDGACRVPVRGGDRSAPRG